ncbi:MAG: FHA domain-containing protein [Candidatus Rifleibacteriota bacterium]
MKVILEIEHGSKIICDKNPFLLGRNPECDYKLPGDKASRKHAQIVVEGEQSFLEDLNSSNGTFVNMVQIKGRVEIFKGDLLRFADVRMKVLAAGEKK